MAFKDNLKTIREFRGKKKAHVATAIGVGRQNLTNWEAGPNEPSSDILDKLSNCLEVPRELFYKKDLTKEYLEKHYSAKNGTDMDKPDDNKGNGHAPKETFYRDLIENNEEYSILPRAVLKDYKIVPDKIIDVIIKSNENEKKALEKSMDLEIRGLNQKYELLIQGYENKIKRLESEKEELLRQIPAKNQ